MAAETANKEMKEAKPPRVGFAQFVREVFQERRKVTWPTWREWRITTIMVFILVTVATLFFFVVDTAIAYIVKLVLTV